jgi:hypothetical protein
MVVFTGGDQYTVGKVPVPVKSAVPYSENVRDEFGDLLFGHEQCRL